MRHCHSFEFFLPTNNLEGQPLRSLRYLSINFISLPPIRLKKKWRLPGVNFLNLSPPITFFPYFPRSFLLSHLKPVLVDFKANLPFYTWFWIYPSLYAHSHLSFASLISPCLPTCTFLKPRLSQPASPCSIPWKAGLTGPPATHRLPCISQIFALCP